MAHRKALVNPCVPKDTIYFGKICVKVTVQQMNIDLKILKNIRWGTQRLRLKRPRAKTKQNKERKALLDRGR